MNRRKALATTGAITLTASAAAIAVGSSIGLFGLTDNGNTSIGKLTPVETHVPAPATAAPGAPSATVTAPGPAPSAGRSPGRDDVTVPGATVNTTSSSTPEHDAFDDPGDDGPETHDDDHVDGVHDEDHDDDD
jgi:hypothetical protein